MGELKSVAVVVLGAWLAGGCAGADRETLDWRAAPGGESTGGDDYGSDGWTSASSTGWTSSGGWSSSSDDGSSSSGSDGGTTIKLVMEDLEYAWVEEDDDPWTVEGTDVDVFPSVPGCIEIYQYTCDGFKKPPWPDQCQSSGYLREFYTEPECVPFQQPSQVVIPCDEFCGEGGGSCEMETIDCGIGQVQSAYCKCLAK